MSKMRQKTWQRNEFLNNNKKWKAIGVMVEGKVTFLVTRWNADMKVAWETSVTMNREKKNGIRWPASADDTKILLWLYYYF